MPFVQAEMDLMQKEAKYLEAQYDFMLSRVRVKAQRAQKTRNEAKKQAQRSALVDNSNNNKMLADLVSQQQIYLDNLRAMLSFSPVQDIVRC